MFRWCCCSDNCPTYQECISTLQPSVMDMTRVIDCFSTPVDSTCSVGGSFMTGKRWIRRTMVYAASVRAKSTWSINVSNHIFFGTKFHNGGTPTPEADPWATIERQVTPFGVGRVVVQRHVFIPSLGPEDLSVHPIKIGPPMHRVDAVRHSSALRNKHG